MLSCTKQNEHGKQIRKPGQVWWHKVESTVFPTLKCALHLVLFCSKSLSVVSKILLPLPPWQTAVFPKSKSEILASVRTVEVPTSGQHKGMLLEMCLVRLDCQSIQPQMQLLGILSTKVLKGRHRHFLLPKEDVSLQPPSAHGSFLSQSIRGFSLSEILILILAGMSSLFT